MVQIRKAPHFLREMLVFPYIKGQLFCEAVYMRGGFPALSAVYADSARVHGPDSPSGEISRRPAEDPIAVDFPDPTFRGAKPLADNVLGEMGCRILFAESDADSARRDRRRLARGPLPGVRSRQFAGLENGLALPPGGRGCCFRVGSDVLEAL